MKNTLSAYSTSKNKLSVNLMSNRMNIGSNDYLLISIIHISFNSHIFVFSKTDLKCMVHILSKIDHFYL